VLESHRAPDSARERAPYVGGVEPTRGRRAEGRRVGAERVPKQVVRAQPLLQWQELTGCCCWRRKCVCVCVQGGQSGPLSNIQKSEPPRKRASRERRREGEGKRRREREREESEIARWRERERESESLQWPHAKRHTPHATLRSVVQSGLTSGSMRKHKSSTSLHKSVRPSGRGGPE
jgi:hypothetical protein